MFRFHSRPVENTRVRVTVVGEFSEGKLKMAVSRCGKKDNFSRKRGRAIAEGRLKKGLTYRSIDMANCTTHDFVEVAMVISEEVKNSMKVY